MNQINLESYEKLILIAKFSGAGVDAKFFVPNRFTKFRVDSLLTKEPETIEWIEEFHDGDILYDVGANVGVYSVWAALSRGTRVYAFEPEAQNYAVLNRNIIYNGLADLMTAYNVAIGDRDGFGTLYLGNFVTGGSGHAFGEMPSVLARLIQ